MSPMLEELKTLYDLQVTDDRLITLGRDRQALAVGLEGARANVEKVRLALEEKKKAREERQKAYRSLESDLRDLEEKIRRFRSQELSCKTNQELWALQKEIRQHEEKRSGIEDRALVTMDEIEALLADVKAAEKALGESIQEAERHQAEVERKLREIDEEEAAARELRKEQRKRVPEDPLARYDRLRAHSRGVGVATVQNRTCSGCFRRITPQDVNLIRRNDRFVPCEGCGAFLFWTDGPVEERDGKNGAAEPQG
jgi:predicted  nucleic acid-binding Zn-ribbon protein